MNLSVRLAAGLGGAAIAVALAIAFDPTRPSAPPLNGWMQNFTPAAIPSPAPATEFADRHAKPARLSEFRGRVVLVNFWATWCGPCVRELPSLARLHARINPEGASVLAISMDRRGWPVMTPFLERLKLGNLPVYHDPGAKTARAVGVRGLPESVLYDREGREIGRLKGPAEWDSDEAVALIRYYLDD